MSAVIWVPEPADHQLPPAQLHDPINGVVALMAIPGDARRTGWGWAVLDAIGKDPRLAGGASGKGGRTWRLAVAWLRALRVRELVISDCEAARPMAWGYLVRLAEAVGCRLWLRTVGPIGPGHRQILERNTSTEWTFDAFARHLEPRQAITTTPPAPPPEPFPAVPVADFTTFRAACRRLLEPTAFACVDARYLAAHHAAADLVDASPAFDSGGLAPFMRAAFAECASDEEVAVVLRATQAALFVRGWFLRVTLTEFASAVALIPRTATRSDADWARLLPYADPYPGVTTALVAAGLEIPQLVGLPVGAVSEDGDVVHWDGQDFLIDPGARVFLRVQRELRLAWGAGQADPLLVHDGRAPSSPRLHGALRTPVRELHLSLVPPRALRLTGEPYRWLRTHGLRLERLSDAA